MRSLKNIRHLDLLRQAALAAGAVFCLLAGPAHAVETPADTSCAKPSDELAPALMERWNAALKTKHPDRLTQLFTKDGSLRGFASPVDRHTYASVREYYLYFLQFDPRAAVTDRKVETGCGYVIDTGSYVWSLKAKPTAAVETREAKYRFVYELVDGDWRIAEHGDRLTAGQTTSAFVVPAPSIARGPVSSIVTGSVPGTAVAGFVKRKSVAAKAAAATVSKPKTRKPETWSKTP